MKLGIIISTAILSISISNACVDNPNCQAHLEKCKIEYKKFLNKKFECIKDAKDLTEINYSDPRVRSFLGKI